MNKEFKKGIIEVCVLLFIESEDRYGYQIVQELYDKFNVKESTIYPILKRLHKDNYLDTYLKESTSGPARKYYNITPSGKKRLKESLEEWENFTKDVGEYINKYT